MKNQKNRSMKVYSQNGRNYKAEKNHLPKEVVLL